MTNLPMGDYAAAAHILILENDPLQCKNIEELLTHWGYNVSVARATIGEINHYESLRNDVLQKMREHQFQVALIDMRLENDESKEDNTGQKLAEELLAICPTLQVVIRSGYQEPRPPNGWKSVEKGDGAEKLKSLIEQTLIDSQSVRSESGVLL